MGMTFITGASSGIGRSLARRIAADGAPVVVVARRKPLLDGLVEEIAQAGGQALAIACDVTDRAAVRDAVRQAEARFGPTARLVANAGRALPSTEHNRHTSATLLLLQDVHPKIVPERLGHARIGITLDTYSHVLPTMQHAAAEKLDQLIVTTKAQAAAEQARRETASTDSPPAAAAQTEAAAGNKKIGYS